MAQLTKVQNDAVELFYEAARKTLLKKCVLSKPTSATEIKVELTLMRLGEEVVIKAVTYYTDGKAIQKNYAFMQTDIFDELFSTHQQINIISGVGNAEYRRSKQGKETLIGGAKLKAALLGDTCCADPASLEGNNRVKNHMLDGSEPFLIELGISSRDGRIFDKKQHKFRQICRFLEYAEDMYRHLPQSGTLIIYDLCCGKSYLSFAIYHYFTKIKGRGVEMTGVDLKSDVVEYCNKTSRRLEFDGLKFVCDNINNFAPDTEPHLVVSLHACDIATDIVLKYAATHRAWVILSTPCCQRELASVIAAPELEFVTKYPILRRKLCEALTDSIRLSYLSSMGYNVDACELVDPDDTPKNILLRAVRRRDFDISSDKAKAAHKELLAQASFLLGEDAVGQLTIL